MRYGYARVSTADQNLDAQRARLIEAGCAEVFADKASGTKASRPEWDKLLAKLQPGDELYCIRLDRIGRSVRHLYEVIAALRDGKVGLACLDQAIDTTKGKGWDDPMAQLLLGILAVIAEFERNLIVERTLDGQAHVRRIGNLRRSNGGPPVLGYRDPGGDEDRDWVLDQAAADWLAEAAERVLAGEPVEALIGLLPEMHDATGRKVNAKMLRAALQRPASAGLIDGLPAVDAAPLDVPTYDRLQALFGSRKRGRPVEADRYPLGPVLRCGKCGNQMTGNMVSYRGQKRPYYACKNPHRGLQPHPCRGVSVPAEDVHLLMRDAIMAWAQTPAARLAAATIPATAGRRGELLDDLAALQDQMADAVEKRRYMNAARYEQVTASISGQIDAVEAELAGLDRIDAQPGVPAVIEWEAMTTAEQLRTITLAYQTPIIVQPGNGGAAARTAAERIELVPLAA
jgi:DNA invertase Pin-like site-specific DNA recombinase